MVSSATQPLNNAGIADAAHEPEGSVTVVRPSTESHLSQLLKGAMPHSRTGIWTALALPVLTISLNLRQALMTDESGYTQEDRHTLERGLRILARFIARAYARDRTTNPGGPSVGADKLLVKGGNDGRRSGVETNAAS